MKRVIFFLASTLMVFFNDSCKKSNDNSGVASLNIIHAAANSPSLFIYFTSTPSNYYLNQISLSYGGGVEFGTTSGTTPLTLVSTDDTTKILLQSTLDLSRGGLYSLYLIDLGSKIDTILMRDTIPTQTDGNAGIRFINLSPDSQPITINLEGNTPTQTEFSGLKYKTITSFRSYPDTSGITSYNFEVRDQASGDLLTTFTWNFNVYGKYTIVISGSEDPTSATPINVFQVNNF